MDNLPDDIRKYDHHPDSPFYVEPAYICEECGEGYDCFSAYNDELCNECLKEQDE